jgi:hypothetical protein
MSDSFQQTLVDSEASTFHFGKKPMNKSTAWRPYFCTASTNKNHEKLCVTGRETPASSAASRFDFGNHFACTRGNPGRTCALQRKNAV